MNNPSVFQSFYHQPYGNKSPMHPSSDALYHQPFVNNSLVHRGTEYLASERVSINCQDAKPLAHELYGSERKLNQNPISNSCLYSAEGYNGIEFSDILPRQVQLPSDYYKGTYPLTVQVPEALPSINISIFSEIHKVLENENDTIAGAFLTNKMDENKTFGDAFSLHKPLENKVRDNYDLHQAFPRFVEGTVDSNKGFDYKIHQTSENKSILFQSCLPHLSVSSTIQDTCLQSHNSFGRDFNSNPNMSSSFPVASSDSSERFNPFPPSPQSESNEYNLSNPVHFQASDVSNGGNLHSSMLQQSLKPSFDFEKSYFPEIKAICENSSRLAIAKLDPSTLQDHKTGVSENTGNFVPKTHQPLQNDPIELPAQDSQAQKGKSRKIQLQQPDTGKDGAKKQNHIEFNTRNGFENGSLSINMADLCFEPTAKNIDFNSASSKPSGEFIMKEDLHGSSSKLDQGLSLECIRNVNIFILGLNDCDTVRLVKTLARYSSREIPQAFGLAFQGSIGTPAMSLKIKCWRLQNSGSFASLRISGKSSRNVIILVYDITQKLDLLGLRPEIESLKHTNFPIVLVGNTSNAPNWDRLNPEDTTCYGQGFFIKDFYNLSLFLQCSIESNEDTNCLITASMRLALRQKKIEF